GVPLARHVPRLRGRDQHRSGSLYGTDRGRHPARGGEISRSRERGRGPGEAAGGGRGWGRGRGQGGAVTAGRRYGGTAVGLAAVLAAAPSDRRSAQPLPTAPPQPTRPTP